MSRRRHCCGVMSDWMKFSSTFGVPMKMSVYLTKVQEVLFKNPDADLAC